MIQEIPLLISGFEKPFILNIDDQISTFNECLASFPRKTELLSTEFLHTIETCPPEGLKPFYASLQSADGKHIGFFLFQIKYFKANQSIKSLDQEDIFCRIHKKLKSLVANLVEFNTLVCGNLLLTGPYGYVIKDEYRNQLSLIYQYVIEEVQGWLRAKGTDTNVILVKDFFDYQKPLEESTFHSFSIQPNMIMELKPEWQNFNDYLEALHSKYRIRVRRAIKAADKVIKKELSLEEITLLNDDIYKLYKQTATHAEFNLLDFHPNYFSELKKNLKDSVEYHSYWMNGKIVAFFTLIRDGMELEAHFLGIDETLNKKNQLYLNILFDIIRIGIDNQMSVIRFSRTAIEIKSSVGAIPNLMTCYIKHRKVINNTFVPYLLDFLNQKNDYVIRHPFKTSEDILLPVADFQD